LGEETLQCYLWRRIEVEGKIGYREYLILFEGIVVPSSISINSNIPRTEESFAQGSSFTTSDATKIVHQPRSFHHRPSPFHSTNHNASTPSGTPGHPAAKLAVKTR
jgi:hypothetical protein